MKTLSKEEFQKKYGTEGVKQLGQPEVGIFGQANKSYK